MRPPVLPAVLALAVLALPLLSGCAGETTGPREAAAEVSAPPASTPPASTMSASPPSASSAAQDAPDYDPKADAAADIAAALKAAKKDGRPVLVDFGADWCLDCRVLGARFAQPGPSALLARYHVVKVDVGEFDHNLDIAGRYVDLLTSGIPALAVLDAASGRIEVATNQGEFANAHAMSAAQVEEFLKQWA
ncbi:thioredoxin family protein [Streptomyces sp. NPDC047046]|uniref:thioredoxin family protein n=1 Tax=Streptomyces sp. NPDC047046 TaxID=3155378 RepID=UPI0033CDABDF